MLSRIPKIYNEKILATWNGSEDAALWTIDDKRVGILTVDFITPVVDDARIWGQIAAANSLSDVFAMGGLPIVALNVVCFPTKKLELSVLEEVLIGGFEKVNEAGAFLAGGHSVQDDEPKYGLVVYGEVENSKKWLTTGARDGDELIITKPLGTGIITTAIKADMVEDQSSVDEALRWMTTINDIPRHLPPEMSGVIHACTDVTGFGLAGHALDMLSGGELNLDIDLYSLPVITGARELAAGGMMPEGSYRNHIAFDDKIVSSAALDDTALDMLFDAQTSGGLLFAVEPDASDTAVQFCRRLGFECARSIGRFSRGTGNINVK